MRRRPLAFEQCESRLALSAATQTAVTIDRDLFVSPEMPAVLPHKLVGADWSQVSFRPGNGSAQGFRAAIQIDLIFNPAPAAGGAAPTEGGLITLDGDWANRLGGDFQLQFSGAIVDAAFNIHDSGLAPRPNGDGGFFDGDMPAIPHDRILPSQIDGVDAWDPTNYGDVLGEDGLNSATNGTTFAGDSPILRITAPLAPIETEGGTIDLTAMAAPTSAFQDASTAMLATRVPAAPTASPRAAMGSALRHSATIIENLRARAVVYEVAFERDGEIGAARDAERLDPTAQREPRSADDATAPAEDVAAPVSNQRQAAPNDAGDPTVAAAREVGVGDAAAATERVPAANESANVAAGARDAALAAWDNAAAPAESSGESESDGGLALAEVRTQQIGLAVALVAGAAPLVKRARRAKSTPLAEKSSGLP